MTTTPQIGLSKPAAGANSWDVDLNGNADILDGAFHATTGHDHSGATGHAPKLTQANSHQSPDTDSATTALHHTLGTGANQAAAGNDGRLANARTPTAHATSHAAAGSDPLTLTAAQVSDFGTAVGTTIHGATAKTTPVDADETALIDAAASNALKRVTWANVKATLKTYFDTLYAAVTHTHAAADITSGVLAIGRLATGTPDGTKFVRDDGTLAVPPGTGGGGGGGDASTNTSTSVDSEIALFSGTAGKTLKRATTTGLLKATSGVIAAAVANTDYATPNQDTTGKAAKADALNSATTVVNVAAATAPTTGQVLTATDSTHATWQTPSGGGGASISRGADASRPAAGNAGALYLPTDGFAAHEDNGTNWRQWGPLFPFTAPVDGDFSWVNQGGASVVAQHSGIFLTSPNNGAADNLRVRVKSAPGTPYTVTVALQPLLFAKNYQSCGLVWRQSSDGKLVGFAQVYNNGMLFAVEKWNSATSFNADYTSVGRSGPWPFMRLKDDATTRSCQVSADGQNWLTIHSVGRTDFMTPDQVGFYANANNNATPNMDCGVTILSWVEA